MDLREIDRLVAEKVMGQIGPLPRCWCTGFEICPACDGTGYYPYSSNIADAWKVVEKMSEDFWFSINRTAENRWDVGFVAIFPNLNPSFDAEAETVPLAICLAALKSAGVEIT